MYFAGSPEKGTQESSPHKIILNGEEPPKTEIVGEQETKPIESPVVSEDTQKEAKVKSTRAKRELIVNQSMNQDAGQNHKLTEYFAVRRSVRKPKTALLEEKQKCLEEAVLSGSEDGLEVRIHFCCLWFESIKTHQNELILGAQLPGERPWCHRQSFVPERRICC